MNHPGISLVFSAQAVSDSFPLDRWPTTERGLNAVGGTEMHARFDFTGSNVLVTGAGRNIGRSIALEFAKAGANVAINVRRNEQEGELVAQEARSHGVRVNVYVADVADFNEVAPMITAVKEDFGFIDIYISNVGLRLRQSLEGISLEDWRRVLDTNLSASFFLAKLLVADMKRERRGRIVHMSGLDGFIGQALRAHTVATKAGLHGFTKALALEVAEYGITVNTVVPGIINTTRPKKHYPHWDPIRLADEVPLRRIGDPREIAWTCMFLASDEAGYITGQAIHVNGGLAMF